MRFAIIVSGVVRNMINASNSWCIPGDYYLVADENVYESQSTIAISTVVDELSYNLTHSRIKFKTVTIVGDTIGSNYNAAMKMAWKWKVAYYTLIPYHKLYNYDVVFLLRPDIWIKPEIKFNLLDKLTYIDDVIYCISGINNENTPSNYSWMNDVFLAFTINTFEKISTFYEYYIANYNDILNNGYEIHTMLAKFIIENKLNVSESFKDMFLFSIIRNNCDDLFENGVLKSEYTIQNLYQKNMEWHENFFG